MNWKGGKRYLKRGEKGFYETAEKHGIQNEIINLNLYTTPDFTKLTCEICEKGVTAMIVTRYSGYGQLLSEIRASGKRIPEDISLIVYEIDRIPEAMGLTALSFDEPSIYRKTVEQFIKERNGESGSKEIIVPGKISIRRSTARVAQCMD